MARYGYNNNNNDNSPRQIRKNAIKHRANSIATTPGQRQ